MTGPLFYWRDGDDRRRYADRDILARGWARFRTASCDCRSGLVLFYLRRSHQYRLYCAACGRHASQALPHSLVGEADRSQAQRTP